MNRNLLCGSLLGTGACLAAALPAVAAGTGERPNILFIVADDLGWGDVGYHGSVIPTPNIDALAARGIEMNRFYTAPVSSPTRAGLMTGRYPSRFGIRKTVIPPWRDYGLDPEEQTLADMLAANGYAHRAIVGKWHLGHGRRAYYPLNRGFTHFYGCLNGALDYFTHEREGELDWHNDWESCRDEGYSTDLIADEAVRCIGGYASEGPFFLYVAFNAPHTPFQAPEDEIAEHISPEKFAALTPREKDAYTYRAMVTRMDKGVGRILEKLERSGLVENTLVLFMSDNGGIPNLPGGSSCAPLRGHKGREWDGGLRVPAVLCRKGRFAEGVRSEQLAAFVDMAPTIAALVGAGEPPRPYDGVNLLPALTGETASFPRDLYLGCGAAVSGDCKPLLSELLDATEAHIREKGGRNLRYNIEIKASKGKEQRCMAPDYKTFTDLCMAVILEKGLGGRVTIQSFDARVLNYLHEKYPGIRTSYLIYLSATDFDKNLAKLNFIPDVYSPKHTFVDETLVAKAHAAGMEILPWTVDDEADLQRLARLSVDGVITNYPDRALRLFHLKE